MLDQNRDEREEIVHLTCIKLKEYGVAVEMKGSNLPDSGTLASQFPIHFCDSSLLF